MKRRKRIWIYVLLILLAAAAAVVIWQRQNLRAVYTVVTADKETIAQDLAEKDSKKQELLDRYDVPVTLPTMEQREQMIKGKLSAGELKQQMGLLPADEPDGAGAGKTGTPSATGKPSGTGKPSATGKPPAAAPQTQAPAVPEAPDDPAAKAAALVEDCIRSLCDLQVDMLAQLGSYRQDALNEWNALSKEERTESQKMQIALEGLDRCEALEKESDAKVHALLDACRGELTALGASTDVLDELWDSYSAEKQSTKTYFLSQYA